jgi:uncharacterized protein
MTTSPSKETPLALVTKLEVNASNVGDYVDWLTRVMMLGIESSGVLNAEIRPPFSSNVNAWILVQRFYSLEQLKTWQASDEHHSLLEELLPDINSKKVTVSESVDSTVTTCGGVAVAVVTRVKKGQEKDYFAYERKYQSAQAHAPGYSGSFVQPPIKKSSGIWTTIIRFDSPQSMENWLASDEHNQLRAESNKHVQSTDFHAVTTSFPGWFPNETYVQEGPPNWKTALLILLGLYPSVMIVILYGLPLLQGYSLAVSNFIGNIVTVAFTTWISMPLFIKLYHLWLFPNETTPKWVNAISLLSLILFFALEIFFFWRYF